LIINLNKKRKTNSGKSGEKKRKELGVRRGNRKEKLYKGGFE